MVVGGGGQHEHQSHPRLLSSVPMPPHPGGGGAHQHKDVQGAPQLPPRHEVHSDVTTPQQHLPPCGVLHHSARTSEATPGAISVTMVGGGGGEHEHQLHSRSLPPLPRVPYDILMKPGQKYMPNSSISAKYRFTPMTLDPRSISEVTMGNRSFLVISKSKAGTMQVTVPCCLLPSSRDQITTEHASSV